MLIKDYVPGSRKIASKEEYIISMDDLGRMYREPRVCIDNADMLLPM